MARLLPILLVLVCTALTRADDAFFNKLDLAPIQRVSVQHNQTVKTFDTYARDVLVHITGKSSRDKKPAVYVVLDMMLDPHKYEDANVIYIRNKPFRRDFDNLSHIKAPEKERILKEGTISLKFWLNPDTQKAMAGIRASSTEKGKAINEISSQAATLMEVMDYPGMGSDMRQLALIAPIESPGANARPWSTWAQTQGALEAARGRVSDARIREYADAVARLATGIVSLSKAWPTQDADAANAAIREIAGGAQQVNPAIYPSETKRAIEVRYNSLARLTWPGAAVYFLGFLAFAIAARTDIGWIKVSAWVLTLAGFAVHTAGIAVRWWLVEKSVGVWYESIPIKNQFESVMFAAWFGTVVALLLESGLIHRGVKLVTGYTFKGFAGTGIFGIAASLVGVASLVALFVVPFMTKNDIIGGSIKQNAGILMTYWLYIHVTLVTASYALIGMTAVIGIWYLFLWFFKPDAPALKTLDSANLTMLQLAFWILGIGIITGALWADVSWGRPWGWDPKETFALITWIVYLIIVHVRFVTHGERRAMTTAILSVVGCGVMLFNWIGVNFFLVGLHSYA